MQTALAVSSGGLCSMSLIFVRVRSARDETAGGGRTAKALRLSDGRKLRMMVYY